MKGRWIRLDTTWSNSGWLAELSPESRLVWIELLCYCKAHGIAGRVKAVSPDVFARNRNVTRDAVTVTLEAAKADGALEAHDGEWVLTGWQDYQTDADAAERQRRYRQRKKQLSRSTKSDTSEEALRNDHNVTRNVTQSNGTETGTVTDKKKSRKKKKTAFPDGWEPKESHHKKAEELGLDANHEAMGFEHFHLSKGNTYSNWDQAFFSWLRKAHEFADSSDKRGTTEQDRKRIQVMGY